MSFGRLAAGTSSRASVRLDHGPGRAVLAAGAVLFLAVLAGLGWGNAPAEAVFPGLNGRIACGALRPATGTDQEIISVNPDGSDEKVLTDNPIRDGGVAFSPDGTRVAFVSRRVAGDPLNDEIYVANNDGDLEGPDVKRLTFNPATTGGTSAIDFAPSWSPDGTQIVFHSGRSATFGPPDLGTSPANDFEIYKMSSTVGEDVKPATRLTFSRGQDAIPAWSPDGTKIAWQRLYQGANPNTDPLRGQNLEVWTMNPDGSGQTNVSNNPGSPNDPATPPNENSNGLDRDVTWSPDGRQLAFSSTRSNLLPGNQNFEVFKMNRDGSNQTRLTLNLSGDSPGQDNDYDVVNTWSPDGQRILFSSGRTSTPTTSRVVVYSMDANAGEAAGLQPVTQTDVFFEKCDWQALARSGTPPTPAPAPAPGGKKINGTSGNDVLVGTRFADVINGGGGNDIIRGGGGDDAIDCGSGNDRVFGGSGNDRIDCGSGNDRVFGNEGNDRLSGGSGNDRLYGNEGDDRLLGGAGNDRLAGGEGFDRLFGNGGRDVLFREGRDRLSGGPGRDRIVR
ncbi:MAG: hypothetical protein M3301_07830 [Chloroflexota bacterium]|nr:hypothetical protein [Chloroflexota bacterium]